MEESTPKPSYSTQQASTPPPVDRPPDPYGPQPKYMSKKVAIIVAVILMVLVVAGIMSIAGTFSTSNKAQIPTPSNEPAPTISEVSSSGAATECQNIAKVAARLPKERSAVIHPVLTDDPEAVPVYPPNTQIIVDESTWRSYGSSGGADAKIMPQDQQVSILFSKHEDCWYITQIDQM